MFKLNIRLLLAFMLSVFVFESCQQDKNPQLIEKTKRAQALSQFKDFLKQDFIPNAPAFKKKADAFLVTPAVYDPVSGTKTYSDAQEKQAKILINPMLTASKKLLATYDFTTKDLPKEVDESAMVILGLEVFVAEIKKQKQVNKAGFLSLIQKGNPWKKVAKGEAKYGKGGGIGKAFSSLRANDYWDCAWRAMGLGGASFLTLSSKNIMTKTAMLKLVGRIAGRLGFGWIGVAIAVVDFSFCLHDKMIERGGID